MQQENSGWAHGKRGGDRHTHYMPRKPPDGRRRTYLREWRKFRGMTGGELAELVGTSEATISRISNGQGYSQEMLESLADALSCEPADILGHDPNSSKYKLWQILGQMAPDQIEKAFNVIKAAFGDVLLPDAEPTALGRPRPFGKRKSSRSR